MIEFFIFFFLFTNVLLTILKEFGCLQSFFEQFPNASGYIPVWSFFAPKPIETDYYLLYRTISNEEEVGPWHQINKIEQNNRFYSFFWNPDMILLKGLVDVISDLLRFIIKENEMKRICFSVPYLHILRYSESLIMDKTDINKIQFMIMSTVQSDDPKLVFLSETHPIAKSC